MTRSVPSQPSVLTETATIPIVEERLEVERRTVPVGTVRLAKSVDTREVVVDEPLTRETVQVERVPVGRILAAGEAPPLARDDGDVLVVPVLEETLVVEKRLVLKEELRITRVRQVFHAPQRVEVRSERVSVQRLDAGGVPLDEAAQSGAGSSDPAPPQQP